MKNKTQLKRLSVAIALSLGIAGPVLAQETTSSLRGVVATVDGKVISGAQITLTDTRTGAVRSFSSNDTGTFSVRGLPVGGPYIVTVQDNVNGSKTVNDVYLKLGETLNLPLMLEQAQIEKIAVTGSRVLNPNYGGKGPASNFNLADLQDAPAINRDIKDVIKIDPRIYLDEGNNDGIQCAGANPRFNSLTVDGVRMNDNFGLNSNGYPTERIPFSFDAISQVAVELAPFDVKYGGFTACNINAVTKSGSNEFAGSVFFDYTNDSMKGDKIEGQNVDTGDFSEKRYGINMGGALVQDKLFVFAAYEKLEGADTFDRGPANSGAAVEVQGVSQAQFDEIGRVAREIYGYEPGGLPASIPNEDEKLLVKLDWFINDNHRAALTYNYNDGFSIAESDRGSDRIEFSNHYYERGSKFTSFVGQLFSDWNDDFSTEFRAGWSELDARVNPLGGTEFGEVQIRTQFDHDNDGTNSRATVYLGADDSRHANKLKYETTFFKLAGTYVLGDHVISGGYEREEYDVYNLFIQEAEGEYVFNSVSDFERGIASTIIYENAAFTNNPLDAAAEFKYAVNTVYLQDEYFMYDYDLTLTYGLRYDWYTSSDQPVLNPGFEGLYGFSNQQNVDGEGLLQPRFGFNWGASDQLEVRGGIGYYSGGNPNVWLSNNYSNNGVTQVEVRGSSTAANTLFNMPHTGAGKPIFDIPQNLFDQVAAGDGRVGGLNVLDPNFKLPSEWKYALGATYTFDNEYVVMADVLYADKKNSAIVVDLSREDTGTTAPDGRPIYTSANGRSQDFMLTNVKGDAGKSLSISTAVLKSYDFGLDWALAYAYNKAEDVNPMTSSVAFSNYANSAVSNTENPGVATSNYDIPHRFTLKVGYKHEFIDGYATKMSLFATRNQGRPFSYAFDRSINTSFGDTVSGSSNHRQLVYVPTGLSDENVVFGDNFDTDAFFAFVNSSGLGKYAGQIAPRNEFNSDWVTKVDVRFEQEIPGFLSNHKGSVFFVIENLGNLLNDDWGVTKEASFPRIQAVVDASINAEGKYVYNEFLQPAGQTRVTDASLWTMRLGVKYKF